MMAGGKGEKGATMARQQDGVKRRGGGEKERRTASEREEGRGMTEQPPKRNPHADTSSTSTSTHTQHLFSTTTLTQRLPWRRARFTTSA
jgi:hypothetical protein